jgi:DNA invertase Pin-like site-specific DNA recombinase
MTKAFGYVRCSSNSQSTADSIATQNDAIARAAASFGVHLQRVFTDIGPASSSQSELEHLLKTAEGSGVRAIVVTDKTRLSRSIAELRRLEERFNAAGIEIISAEA